jgi:hypothetical protein
MRLETRFAWTTLLNIQETVRLCPWAVLTATLKTCELATSLLYSAPRFDFSRVGADSSDNIFLPESITWCMTP